MKSHTQTGTTQLYCAHAYKRTPKHSHDTSVSCSHHMRIQTQVHAAECDPCEHRIRCSSLTLATGARLDASSEPLFAKLREQYPIGMQDGLPELTQALNWREDVDFYVMGGYAQLQVSGRSHKQVGTEATSLSRYLSHSTLQMVLP